MPWVGSLNEYIPVEKYRGIMLRGPTFGTYADHSRKIGAQVMDPYKYKLLFWWPWAGLLVGLRVLYDACYWCSFSCGQFLLLHCLSDSLHYSVLKYSPCRERKQVGIKLQLKVVMTVITKTHERLPEETLEPISWTENHEEPGHREKDRWRHRSNSTISQVQLVQGLWSTDWEREEWAEGQKITEGF